MAGGGRGDHIQTAATKAAVKASESKTPLADELAKISREEFMREIAQMTQIIVKRAKEYDNDTIPGDYATLKTPCPNCGGVVKENYRRYACTGQDGNSEGCGFSFGNGCSGDSPADLFGQRKTTSYAVHPNRQEKSLEVVE